MSQLPRHQSAKLVSVPDSSDRLRRQLQDLHKKAAQESRKDSDASQKAARAREQAGRTSSALTAKSKLREAERYEKQALGARKRRADLDKKIAEVTTKLHTEESRISRQHVESVKRLEEELRQRELWSQIELATALGDGSETSGPEEVEFDFFISHSAPDKDSLARPLAEALRAKGCRVWLDEWVIRVGDSIRAKIDEGLRKSRYGVVILSMSFLQGRAWTERELNGLFVQEERAGEPRILPVWHNVTKEEVARYSPILADKAALKSADYTIDEMAALLTERLMA